MWPTIFAFIIGYELSFLVGFGSFEIMTLQVMTSEFIIMTVISVPVYKLLMQNSKFVEVVGGTRKNI